MSICVCGHDAAHHDPMKPGHVEGMACSACWREHVNAGGHYKNYRGCESFRVQEPVDLATQGGMSMRDYFAIHAPLPERGFDMARGRIDPVLYGTEADTAMFDVLADYKFQFADAMLRRRSK